MAVLKGFPPSNTISPTIYICDVIGKGLVWAKQSLTRGDGTLFPTPEMKTFVEYRYHSFNPEKVWYEVK